MNKQYLNTKYPLTGEFISLPPQTLHNVILTLVRFGISVTFSTRKNNILQVELNNGNYFLQSQISILEVEMAKFDLLTEFLLKLQREFFGRFMDNKSKEV